MNFMLGEYIDWTYRFNAEVRVLDPARECLIQSVVPIFQRAIRRLNLPQERILKLIKIQQLHNKVMSVGGLTLAEKDEFDKEACRYVYELRLEQGDYELARIKFHFKEAFEIAADTRIECLHELNEASETGDHISFRKMRNLYWILESRRLGCNLPGSLEDIRQSSLIPVEAQNEMQEYFRAFEKNFLAKNNLAPNSYLFRWIIDHREVFLLNETDQLVCYVWDKFTGTGQKSPIDCGEYSLEQVAQSLTRSEPVLDGIGNVNFSRPKYITRQKWSFQNRQISLIQIGDLLLWELFDQTIKTKSRILVSNDLRYMTVYLGKWPSKRCIDFFQQHSATVSDLQLGKFDNSFKDEHQVITYFFLRHIDVEERLDVLCDFEVCEVKEENGELYSVTQKKVIATSRLDKSILVDRDKWAITFITAGTSNSNPTTWGGHGVIVIEGLRQGKYFLDRADLIESGIRYIKNSSQENLKYGGKTETWLRDRFDVEQMIEAIQWEIRMKEAGQKTTLFNIFGRDSIFSTPQVTPGVNWDKVLTETPLDDGEFAAQPLLTPDNCATWAHEKLELADIKISKSKLRALITLPKTYTHSPSNYVGDAQEYCDRSLDGVCKTAKDTSKEWCVIA
jgi:hypothetical protein